MERFARAGTVVLMMLGLGLGACSGGDASSASTDQAAPSSTAPAATTQAASSAATDTPTTAEVEAETTVTAAGSVTTLAKTRIDGRLPRLVSEAGVLQLVPVIVDVIPHDPAAFTQGLVLADGRMYESTGQYGESTVRELDPATGEVVQSQLNDAEVFGEGLAIVGDQLIQLTWQEEVAFVWDADTLSLENAFSYSGQGWGLCADGERLVMSDGSDMLTFRDPATFDPLGAVAVTLDGEALTDLNELECVEGLVVANVWRSNTIVVIDPEDGRVAAQIDASSLAADAIAAAEGAEIDVLNGVAFDESTGGFYLTGKLWPTMYLVMLEEA